MYIKNLKLNVGLIDKCQYELEVLKSLEKLLHGDLHNQLAKAIGTTKQGVANPVICSSCKQKILMEPLFVFRYIFYLKKTNLHLYSLLFIQCCYLFFFLIDVVMDFILIVWVCIQLAHSASQLILQLNINVYYLFLVL